MTALAIVLVLDSLSDGSAVMEKVAEKLAASSEAKRQYIYEKHVCTGLWNSSRWASRRAAQHEQYDLAMAGGRAQAVGVTDGFAGECHARGQVQPFTRRGYRCSGLAPDDMTSAEAVVRGLLDETRSLDGVPFWLLPFRPAALKFFAFRLRNEVEIDGRRVYVIDFRPARHAGGDQKAWQGTVWIDAADLQIARLSSLVANPGHPPFDHVTFTVDYQRTQDALWFPVESCAGLWGAASAPGSAMAMTGSDEWIRRQRYSSSASLQGFGTTSRVLQICIEGV